MSDQWGIVCPGPSLKKFTKPFWPKQGSLIAVNAAILMAPADYWSVNDPEVFKTCLSHMTPDQIESLKARCLIWTHENFENAGMGPGKWDHDTRKHWQEFPKLLWDIHTWRKVPHIFSVQTEMRHCSFFSSIGFALFLGARTIHIFGADMGGSGYFMPGVENERTRHTEARWRDERLWFEIITDECMEEGIQFYRYFTDGFRLNINQNTVETMDADAD